MDNDELQNGRSDRFSSVRLSKLKDGTYTWVINVVATYGSEDPVGAAKDRAVALARDLEVEFASVDSTEAY